MVLGGTDVTRATPHLRARRGLGRTFQTSAVFGSLSAMENVALAVRARQGCASRPWRSRADRAVTEERLRIARELHDDVAHQVSVVAIQAGMPDVGTKTFEIIVTGKTRIDACAAVSAAASPMTSARANARRSTFSPISTTKTGTSSVTVTVLVGPTFSMRRK